MADEYRQNKNYPTLLQQHNDNKNKVKNVRQLLKKKKHPPRRMLLKLYER